MFRQLSAVTAVEVINDSPISQKHADVAGELPSGECNDAIVLVCFDHGVKQL